MVKITVYPPGVSGLSEEAQQERPKPKIKRRGPRPYVPGEFMAWYRALDPKQRKAFNRRRYLRAKNKAKLEAEIRNFLSKDPV